MVRANYNNLQKGVHETTEYLELFLKNLLLGEKNRLQNRTMHISGALKQDSEPVKQDFKVVKQDSAEIKQDFDKLTSAGISVRSTNNIIKLIQKFGYDIPFGRMDIARELEITKSPASEILNKLLSIEAIVSVTGAGKGKYKFNQDFFKNN